MLGLFQPWTHSVIQMSLRMSCIPQTNVFMKKLDLSWNGFSLEGAMALGDALKGNSVLEELDIS